MIRRLRGITGIEVLVIIAIIAVLIALILPAVFAAKEAAERANEMKNPPPIVALANPDKEFHVLKSWCYATNNRAFFRVSGQFEGKGIVTFAVENEQLFGRLIPVRLMKVAVEPGDGLDIITNAEDK